VNVYWDKARGREFIERTRAALSVEAVAHVTEIGRRLTIGDRLRLSGPSDLELRCRPEALGWRASRSRGASALGRFANWGNISAGSVLYR